MAGVTGLEWVLAALAIVILTGVVSIVAVVLVIRAVFRRIRRSRTVSGATLKTRAQFSRGPQRTILALRVRLGELLASGQAAVDLAANGAGPRGDLPRLFARIRQEGVALDAQLRLLESETDPGVLADEVPAARRRVDQVAVLVRHLRAAVASGLTGPSDDALTTLRADMDREVAALYAGIEELHALTRPDLHRPIASTVREKETPS
ncbi:hypothetical protein [Agromyces mariniharenae]|uniref:Uncharacterized protein n=1 Tax=Agromyces mariniharenae TaxID=2604423 RepID=A0A5S4V6K1_9MICO|nr:hypothetical protein [Agromyces mariniharenae]TYL54464.1 hypothetical protein FYC51_13035 [Agromyces mariniharenae]